MTTTTVISTPTEFSMLSNRLGGTVSNAIEAALHDRVSRFYCFVSRGSHAAAPTQ